MQNKELQVFVSAAFAGLLYYLGIVSIPIIMLIFAMIIDYATGMSAAFYNSELSSKRGVKGIVKKVDTGKFPFTSTQKLNINYMSTHPTLYKHLKANPQFIKVIAAQEKASNGKTYRYIPKSLLNRSESELQSVHTGDIVSLITKKEGLDTSHVGIAVWQQGKLHLMHASSLNKKVVLDPTTFYDYGQKQTSMLGIRVYTVVH